MTGLQAKIPGNVLDVFGGRGRLEKLYPPQLESLKSGLFQGKNILLCTGTGSGKTLVAELAALKTVLSGKKVVYITPLRALSGEKYEEFKGKYGGKFKISLSIGGLDKNGRWLSGSDIIFLTTEKLDALMRHRAEWLGEIGLLVADEIHEIGGSRGPTLEMVIVKIRRLVPSAQILALSATVGNAGELADWLGAKLVESSFRPVPLKEGVICGRKIVFKDEGERHIRKPGAEGAVLDCLEGGSQALVFNNTRRSSEKTAEELAEITDAFLRNPDRESLKETSKKILDALPSPTAQCEKLAGLVLKGAAFHHAGLVHGQKLLVEECFRSGKIKALSATVTLVAGMNLPARRIVIKGLVGWGDGGPREWPVSLYKQAVGRAGRPGLDSIGESLVVARDEAALEDVFENYIRGKPEEVSSLLGSPPILRREILGAISAGFVKNLGGLVSFFEETFYAHRNGGVGRIRETLVSALEELDAWGFVKYSGAERKSRGGFLELSELVGAPEASEGEISLTKLGQRVSELYLDPLSAKELVEGLKAGNPGTFNYLVLLASTTELMPGPSVRVAEREGIWTRIAGEKLSGAPEPWEPEAEVFAKSVKLAIALEAWIGEISDREIMERFSIAPGDLRSRLVNSDWVCYSAAELAKICGLAEARSELAKLQIRLEHGIKEELISLIKLPGIGRVRARKLFAAGLKNPSAVLNTKKERLAAIVGEKTAEKLLST
ncbi:MAG: DEAD/DEAH box helicase [archaeon]